jgi:hypothetical protein
MGIARAPFCLAAVGPFDAIAEGTHKEFMELLTTVPLLIIDDFGLL